MAADPQPSSEIARLVRAADGGDASAYDRLFERALPILKAFIRVRAGQVLRGRESVEDLAQSVCREMLADMISAGHKPGRGETFHYRGESEFRSWLLLLATRKVLQRQRFHVQERRDVRREVVPRPTSAEAGTLITAFGVGPTPSQVASAHEQAEYIERVIGGLPDGQRDAVTMSRLMGLDYDAIGGELGCSASAARGLVSRGLAVIAAALQRRALGGAP